MTSLLSRSPLRGLVRYTWKIGKEDEKNVIGKMTFSDQCRVTVSGHGAMGSLSKGTSGTAWKSFSTMSTGYYIQPEAVIIEEGVTSISPSAFAGYNALDEVSLPKSMVEIEESAFYKCGGLHEIHYAGTCKEWEEIRKGDHWIDEGMKVTIICQNGEIIEKGDRYN